MNRDMADISVVAANYNNGPFLNDFIESIMASTLLPAELIIVDDGSTDNSREILRSFENLPNARFIYCSKNTGFANALTSGIEMASCKYIMRADPDDVFHPDRIRQQYEYLEKHPELSGIGCNVRYFHYKTGKSLNKSNFPCTERGIARAYQKGEHGMQHPTIMMKAVVFKSIRYRQEWVPAEDYDFVSRLVINGHRFVNLPEALYNMRVHPGSASSWLTFGTIRKTYLLREEITGHKTSLARQYLYYAHIRMYRNYLLETNLLKKAYWLTLSAGCYPKKILRRLRGLLQN